MSTERFNLRTGSNTIYLYYRNGRGINFRWSTKIKVINQKNWIEKNQKIRDNKIEIGAYGKNAELRNIMSFFIKCFPNNKTKPELKKILDDEFRNSKEKISDEQPEKMQLFNYFKDIINNDISKATKSSYQNSYNHLERYNNKLTFDDIDLNFYDNYTRFLKSVKTTHKGKPLQDGYSANTIAASIKVLKTVMGKAYKRSLHSNRSYSLDEFKVEFEEGEQIFLSEEEINKTLELNLDELDLIDTRKYFIIGCYSSLRISDVLRLDEDFFDEDMIKIKMFKGDKPTKKNKLITIPVNSKIRTVIANGLPKRKFNYHTFNKNIRKLCELAGIEKHSEVSSHTMRRSFCTNAYNSGIDLEDVSFLMGHSSTRITRNYLKLSNSDRAKRLKEEHSFLK